MKRRIRLMLALMLVPVATLTQALFAAADVPEALNMEIEMEAVGSLENATGDGRAFKRRTRPEHGPGGRAAVG